MPELSVYLFGKFQVRIGQQLLPGFDGRRAQELFCYLLLFRDRPHTRESLANMLWGDQSTTQSKKYLRHALWQVQSALELHEATRSLLLTDTEWLQINPASEIWLDVGQLERAFVAVHGQPGPTLSEGLLTQLHAAVAHYRGDLLEGWYQDWCLYQRERLQTMYLALLDKMMGYCEAHNQYEQGIQYGTAILGLDRARERSHRRLMRLHYLVGDRTAALRQYGRCRAALMEELGVQPARSTAALYEQIRADQLPLIRAGVTSPGAFPLLNALDRLKQLHLLLGSIQHQINQEIAAVEQALNEQGGAAGSGRSQHPIPAD